MRCTKTKLEQVEILLTGRNEEVFQSMGKVQLLHLSEIQEFVLSFTNSCLNHQYITVCFLTFIIGSQFHSTFLCSYSGETEIQCLDLRTSHHRWQDLRLNTYSINSISYIKKHCFPRGLINEYFENSQILTGTNNLDVFCSGMYSYARVDYQSTISTEVACWMKNRLSNRR